MIHAAFAQLMEVEFRALEDLPSLPSMTSRWGEIHEFVEALRFPEQPATFGYLIGLPGMWLVCAEENGILDSESQSPQKLSVDSAVSSGESRTGYPWYLPPNMFL